MEDREQTEEAYPDDPSDEPETGADYGSADPDECSACLADVAFGFPLFGKPYCLNCAACAALGVIAAADYHEAVDVGQAVIILRAALAEAEKHPKAIAAAKKEGR